VTDTPQEPGDQPTPVPLPAYPDTGHGQPAYGYQPYQPPPPPPGGGRKTGLIVTGVLGLVAGVVIGVAGFAAATDDDAEPSAGTDQVSRVPITTPPTSTTSTESAEGVDEGDYSMSSVGNACDLIDPTLLHKWSAEPQEAPYHRETQPSSLGCTVGFVSLSKVDQVHYNQAGLELEAEFTTGGANPAYDSWKDDDTETTGSGLASGDVTGLGAQAYWHSEIETSGDVGRTYIIAVQDSNVSVRVRFTLLRVAGEPPVSWAEMNAVARSEIQQALNGLKK
jgi:hypothetical protein